MSKCANKSSHTLTIFIFANHQIYKESKNLFLFLHRHKAEGQLTAREMGLWCHQSCGVATISRGKESKTMEEPCVFFRHPAALSRPPGGAAKHIKQKSTWKRGVGGRSVYVYGIL